jgi:CDP-4-dehydro-6-deoxyglucose reductase, E1
MTLPLATDTWAEEELAAIQRVIASRRFSYGPEVKAFEEEFAAHFGARHAVMVNSGSSANIIALAAMLYSTRDKLSPGDQVLVPAVSWSTTYFPIHQLGLEMRFVDIDPDTLNLDLNKLEAAITPKTRAVFAVNLLGNPIDYAELSALCQKHDLLLVEDNCESMGAKVGGKQAGTFGACGTYSTFFSHHISTMEGGVVVTDRADLYHLMLSLRSHGWTREQPPESELKIDCDDFTRQFRFLLPGYNFRPIEMEGAIGREQIRKLDGFVAARRANGKRFQALMGQHPDIRIQREVGESSWFGFAMICTGALKGRRPELVEAFKREKIDTRPIVAGNFTRNPVLSMINHSFGSTLEAADDLDTNGFFIGNHHYDITAALETCRAVIDSVAKKG